MTTRSSLRAKQQQQQQLLSQPQPQPALIARDDDEAARPPRSSYVDNHRGLHQLQHGTLESAILAFQDGLDSMRKLFQPPSSSTQAALLLPECFSLLHQRECRPFLETTTQGDFPTVAVKINRKHGFRSPFYARTFRYGFCFSSVAHEFLASTSSYERVANFSAAIMLYNLALSQQLLSCDSDRSVPSGGKQEKSVRMQRLDLAKQYYQQAYRFLVGACPDLHCGPPSGRALIDLFYLACVNNLAQVEAELGAAQKATVLLKRLVPFTARVEPVVYYNSLQQQQQAINRLQQLQMQTVAASSNNGDGDGDESTRPKKRSRTSLSADSATETPTQAAQAAAAPSEEQTQAPHRSAIVTTLSIHEFLCTQAPQFFLRVALFPNCLLTTTAAAA